MTTKTKDPRQAGDQPPFPEQQQTFPGSDADLSPQADHGEHRYKGSGKLTGRAALVTGADSGIGRAVALAFAREGADVLIAHLSEPRDAAQTERLVKEAGRKAVVMAGDVRDEAHCVALVEAAMKHFGRLDVLVNNAAYQAQQDGIQDVSSEQFERTFRTNVFAPFYLCKAALPRMKAGASVINVVSIQAFDPSPKLLDYAATKSALVSLTKSLAAQAAEAGVRVNAVAPGPVWTPFIPSGMPPQKVAQFGKDSAFGRPAQPAEMAPLFVLLASDEGSYVTGEVWGATGGKMPF